MNNTPIRVMALTLEYTDDRSCVQNWPQKCRHQQWGT